MHLATHAFIGKPVIDLIAGGLDLLALVFGGLTRFLTSLAFFLYASISF
jgi:hypothetical protein